MPYPILHEIEVIVSKSFWLMKLLNEILPSTLVHIWVFPPIELSRSHEFIKK